MATNRLLRLEEIEEYINEEIENEDCSETEDYLEIDAHQSDSEQEGDDDEVNIQSQLEITSQPSQVICRPAPDLRRKDLDCVPLSILRNGYYKGEDNSTIWSIEEPTRNVRTRSHNIIRELARPCGKVVLLASTMHHDAKIDVETGEKRKPEIITDYNTLKCGVDIVDQMTSTYSVSRQTQRWPLYIFFGLLNIGGLNAYIIQKANLPSDNFTRRDFIKTLAISLIEPHLHDRISITNIPQHIKNRIRNIIPENEPTTASNPLPPMGGRKVRCGLCNWKKDRKTKTFVLNAI